MSWDVMIFNLRGASPRSIEELEGIELAPLGAAANVRRQLSETLPGIDWSDPSWGIYEGDGFSIEFNAGDDDPIENMMLHVRGGGDAISAIVKLARPHRWSALDCSTSEFLDLENPSQEGWEGFQAFRDRAFEKYRSEGEA